MSTNAVIPPLQPVKIKADSGATGHYFATTSEHLLDELQPSPTMCVRIPNGETIQANKQGHLIIPNLSKQATKTYTFPHLTTSLLSVGQLCDDNCRVCFEKRKMEVTKNGHHILEGNRNPTDGLWDVDINQLAHKSASLATTTQPNLNVILRNDKSKAELAAYYHATCLFPTTRLWADKIKQGNFISWPGLDVDIIKHLPKSINTYKGHMRHEPKNLRSTKTVLPTIPVDPSNDFSPGHEQRTNDCFLSIADYHPHEKAYMDLTGKFPYVSSRGNKYLLVLYDYEKRFRFGSA